MAGEVGMAVLSCTSRSKIWLPAGDARRGEEASLPGEVGTKWVCSVWIGEVFADRLDATLFLAGSDLACTLDDSSVFFFPKPNRPLFFFFSSASGIARGVESPGVTSASSGSANLGIDGPWTCVVLAKLILVIIKWRICSANVSRGFGISLVYEGGREIEWRWFAQSLELETGCAGMVNRMI